MIIQNKDRQDMYHLNLDPIPPHFQLSSTIGGLQNKKLHHPKLDPAAKGDPVIFKCGIYVVLFTFWFGGVAADSSDFQTLVETANRAYTLGLDAVSLGEKQNHFNQALAAYIQIEENCHGSPSSELSEVIGNIYYALNTPSLALFYYYRASQTDPNKPHLQKKIAFLRAQLGLQGAATSSSWRTAFLLNDLVPQSLRWLLFFLFFCTGIAVRLFSFKKTAKFLFGIAYFFCTASLISYYLTPLEGVLIRTTGLYRQPNTREGLVYATPLLAGSKVELLEAKDLNGWIKIQTDQTGYIPSQAFRAF